MPEQVTNYTCPNCLGGLRYDGATSELACDNCGANFAPDVIEQMFADKEQAAQAAGVETKWDIAATGTYSAEEASHLRGYSCPSCAAEIICDDTTAATSCPYCNNPTVIPGQLSAQLKPDVVIPFKLSREQAIATLTKYYKGKKLLPKSFATSNHIQEIKGVYVPFWLYDAQTDADIRWHGTKVVTVRTGSWETTTTSHYRVARQGTVDFEKVPVDAASKMPNAHMDAIEPFKYDDLKGFSTAYLPGFFADKYDEDAEECGKRANARMNNSTESALENTAKGYSSLSKEYGRIDINRRDVKYALLPVWTLATKWKDKDFLFAMNGQTGKLVGDLPISRGRFWGWFFGIAGAVAAVVGGVAFLLF